MQWIHEPAHWREQDDVLTVTTPPSTDYWRVTRHNFIADNAPFYAESVTGDFRATVKITASYAALYDQAGLMVRESESVWLKCGIEFMDGVQYASAVLTREYSDWSIVPLESPPPSVWFRVERYGSAVEVSYSRDGAAFTLIRQGTLSAAPTLMVGRMCAAPKGNGFEVRFEDYTVAPLLNTLA